MSKLSAENSFAPVCIWVPWGGGEKLLCHPVKLLSQVVCNTLILTRHRDPSLHWWYHGYD